MSCPDWNRLVARRESVRQEDAEPEWSAALEHLDGGCAKCRPRALAADPTLVFRRMPTFELKPAEEASEVDAMRQAVAAMRTASRLEALEPRSRGVSQRRWAAAAILAVSTLALGVGGSWQEQPAVAVAPEIPSVEAEGAFAIMPASWSQDTAGMEMEDAPLVEELSSPASRVYEMRTEGIDAVLIVTGSGSAGV